MSERPPRLRRPSKTGWPPSSANATKLRHASALDEHPSLSLPAHVVCRHDAGNLQLDRVDRVTACDEQRAAIRTAERLVCRADLSLRLAAVDGQVDRTEERTGR